MRAMFRFSSRLSLLARSAFLPSQFPTVPARTVCLSSPFPSPPARHASRLSLFPILHLFPCLHSAPPLNSLSADALCSCELGVNPVNKKPKRAALFSNKTPTMSKSNHVSNKAGEINSKEEARKGDAKQRQWETHIPELIRSQPYLLKPQQGATQLVSQKKQENSIVKAVDVGLRSKINSKTNRKSNSEINSKNQKKNGIRLKSVPSCGDSRSHGCIPFSNYAFTPYFLRLEAHCRKVSCFLLGLYFEAEAFLALCSNNYTFSLQNFPHLGLHLMIS